MKRLLPIFLMLLLLGTLGELCIQPRDERPPTEQFAEAMNYIAFDEYTDPDFGYRVPYPSFFEREQNDSFGIGHVRFGYHARNINIVIECRVVPSSVVDDPRHHFTTLRPLPGTERYSCLSRYVRRGRCWYVLTLSYPDDYRKALSRLIHRVAGWQADIAVPALRLRRKMR
ncbi:MAG: hypothetical protein KA067_00270 [Prevotella sp.]|nr:hypothetical protein [Prevotella sp.]